MRLLPFLFLVKAISAVVIDPPDGSGCWRSTTQVSLADIGSLLIDTTFDDSVERIYTFCPDTVIQVGYLPDITGLQIIGGEFPIVIASPNVHIRCGETGLSSNNCTLRGGQEQLTTLQGTALLEGLLPALPFFIPGLPQYPDSLPADYVGADSTNLIVEGMTFEGSADYETDALGHSPVYFNGPGLNMLIKDCIFKKNVPPEGAPSPAGSAVYLQRWPEFQVKSGTYSSVTIMDSVFEVRLLFA
jgi:hypothetical protein